MIFEFSDSFKEIEINRITENYTVGFLSSAEFCQYYNLLGISDAKYKEYTNININFRTSIDVLCDHIFSTIRVTEPDINKTSDCSFALYIKKKLIIIIEISDKNHTVRNKFLNTVEAFLRSDYMPEKFISTFVDSLITEDNSGLEVIENEINSIENKIINESEYKNFNEELLKYKQKLLNLRNYYKQLIDLGETFSDNENGIFSNENLNYFNMFIKKSERLCADVNLIRENLVQLRETYQSHIDLKLNNIMKIFTVITAFFSPLTLIAGWYGMNFEYMPELKWKYGYIFVILLSISSVVCCLIIFKRKKMM